MYVCIYIYIYICIHTYVCICTCKCIHVLHYKFSPALTSVSAQHTHTEHVLCTRVAVYVVCVPPTYIQHAYDACNQASAMFILILIVLCVSSICCMCHVLSRSAVCWNTCTFNAMTATTACMHLSTGQDSSWLTIGIQATKAHPCDGHGMHGLA